MRLLSALLAVLLLAGCSVWEGPVFYNRSEAINPFRPGTYRLSGSGGVPRLVRWDGRRIVEKGRPWSAEDEQSMRDITAIARPVGDREIFVLQWAADHDHPDRAIYAIMERRGDRYRIDMPDCATSSAIALAAGASIESAPDDALNGEKAEPIAPPSRNCVFRTRDSLEKALRRYINERQLLGPLIERIGD